MSAPGPGSTPPRDDLPPVPAPLPHPVVDNHCHLDIADSEAEWFSTEQALAASAAVGVPRIVQIGCDLPGARWAVEAAATHDALVAGVALHPNEAPRLAASGDLEAAYAEIEALAQAHDKVRAVGETGLDHFRTGEEGRAAQVESFRRHVDIAKRLDKLDRRITRLERDTGIGVEMIALFVRFWLSNTPPPPETERAAMRRLGNDRYDAFMEALGRRLAKGPKVRQEIGEDFPHQEE